VLSERSEGKVRSQLPGDRAENIKTDRGQLSGDIGRVEVEAQRPLQPDVESAPLELENQKRKKQKE